jgi:hypothetical protein
LRLANRTRSRSRRCGERRQRLEVGRREVARDPLDLGGRKGQRLSAKLGELRLDRTRDLRRAHLVDQDLDARLVLVVPSAFEVVDAEDGLAVGEQVGLREEVAHLPRHHRRPSLAAADPDREAERARGVALEVEADVMHLDGGAVARRGGHRHLELPRQERELRVERRPLPQDLGIGPRVGDLVGGGAGEVVGGDVADAVARGLDRVHLDLGQLVQDLRDVLEPDPVELQVLPRGEVAVAPVERPADPGEAAHLARGEGAVGNGDPQHVGVELQIDAVHQPERLELLLGQRAGEPAGDLVAELGRPLAHEGVVELVIPVHRDAPVAAGRPWDRTGEFVLSGGRDGHP